MNYEDERYVRLYVRDTVTWRALKWEGQAVVALLMRKVDRAGVFDLSGFEPIEAVCEVLDMPVEVVTAGLTRAFKLKVIEKGNDCLVYPKFIEAQEATQSDAQRQRESRGRHRDQARKAAPTATPENAEDSSKNVTPCHDPSRAVTSGHSVPSVPSEPSVPSVPKERDTDVRSSETDSANPLNQEPGAEQAPLPLQLEPPPPSQSPEEVVFAHWVSHWKRVVGGNRPPKFDEKRSEKIAARLKEGFSVADLMQAADGIWSIPFNLGENPDRKMYVKIDLLYRDAEHVETYMAAAPVRDVSPSATTVDPNVGPDGLPFVSAPEGWQEALAKLASKQDPEIDAFLDAPYAPASETQALAGAELAKESA